jgi:chromosome partitioning protein
LLSLNALTAVREVVIPLQPHFLALQGLGKLLETVTIVRRRINPNLSVSGILLCMYDRRVTLSAEVRTDIEKFLASARGSDCAWAQAQVIPTPIRPNVKLAESPSYGKTIFEYDDSCNGAADYHAVADYFHVQLGKPITEMPPSPPPVDPAPPTISATGSDSHAPTESVAEPVPLSAPVETPAAAPEISKSVDIETPKVSDPSDSSKPTDIPTETISSQTPQPVSILSTPPPSMEKALDSTPQPTG